MGRRRQENALSLFAFQDIITGVAGVMLFILLLLVVQLAIPAAQKIQAKDSNRPLYPVAVDADVQRLENMRRQLASLRNETDDLIELQSISPDAMLDELQKSLDATMGGQQTAEQEVGQLMDQLRSAEATSTAERINREIESMQTDLSTVEAELDRLASGSFIAFRTSDSNADVWLVDVRARSAELMSLKDPTQTRRIQFAETIKPNPLARRLAEELKRNGGSQSIVMLIRPSASGRASELIQSMRSLGYKIALELLDSQTQILQRPTSETGGQP